MAYEKTYDILNELIKTCQDAHNGFREAAENVQDPELRTFFLQQSEERVRFASELEREAQALGEKRPERSGSVAGAAHRAWMDIKASFGGGETSILESVERGEDSAKEAYEKALREPLSESILGLIRRQAQSVFNAHDRVKALRDMRKAA
jgi:uncharacterized protein (TIGR02284 family)